jgi:hypothetical protein
MASPTLPGVPTLLLLAFFFVAAAAAPGAGTFGEQVEGDGRFLLLF